MKPSNNLNRLLTVFVIWSLVVPHYESVAQSATNESFSDRYAVLGNKSLLPKTGNSAVNTTALRNFLKSNPQAEDVKWSLENNYYFVHFRTGNVKQKSVYNRKGNEVYSLKMYTEHHLPKSIRASVKSIYYDYLITTVEELKVRGNVIYLVHLHDRTYWKTVRVCEGQLEEIESLVDIK